MAVGPDITGLLKAWKRGDPEALGVLAVALDHDLRAMARRLLADERRDARWRPTELIQELYLRLLDWHGIEWKNRAQFFAAASRMMRHALVDAARARRALKRGDGMEPVPLDEAELVVAGVPVDIIDVGDALEALAGVHPRASQVVEMRFFGGFSVEETAEALGVSERTVINDWNAARAWLYRALSAPLPVGSAHDA